jgi:hypothetical protein
MTEVLNEVGGFHGDKDKDDREFSMLAPAQISEQRQDYANAAGITAATVNEEENVRAREIRRNEALSTTYSR